MRFDLSSDQEFLQATTGRCLADHVPPGQLRRLRHDPTGFDASYWAIGATLGWTSLLVSEDNGGGSISGEGLIDLTLIAYEFGGHAAPGNGRMTYGAHRICCTPCSSTTRVGR